MNATTTCTYCNGTGFDIAFNSACVCGASPDDLDATTTKVVAAIDDDRELASWLGSQTWSDFAQSLSNGYQRYGSFTPKQKTAALSMRAKCEAKTVAPKAVTAPVVDANPISDTLVAGHYTVDGVTIHVDRPTQGKWAGWIFVTYDGRDRIVSVYPSGRVYWALSGAARAAAEAIITEVTADPYGAACKFGEITGHCFNCGHELTHEIYQPDQDGIHADHIGPKCAADFGRKFTYSRNVLRKAAGLAPLPKLTNENVALAG